jgi:beta-glucanase (GH16 family)
MKFSRTRGLNVLAALSAAFLISCGGGGSDSDVATKTDTSSFNPQQPVSDWQLVWSDEFSGSQINSKNWTVLEDDCGGGGNQEKQCYTDNAENVFVQDGNLNIVAKPAEEGAPQPYTSARLHSKNKGDFKYGRFEIRAQLPEGQGAWPAIWMMPTDSVYGGWPNSGEIDIVEAVNLKVNREDGTPESHVYGTLHYGKMDANGNDSSTGKAYMLPDGVNPADGFHTYALEWNEGEMRWYVDGYLYATQRSSDVLTNSKDQAVGLRHQGWHAEYYSPATGEMAVDYSGAPFDQHFYLIMNLAVGGNWPENVNDTGIDADAFASGQTLKVDYVRVYECSMNPETGKGCETVRAGYDMLEADHPTGALLVGEAPIPTPPAGPTIENLSIFTGTANPNWAAWDCCGGSTPGLVADADRGDVYQFEVGAAPTVLGFVSRTEFLGDDGVASPFDASAMAESGSLSFDLNVVTPPNNADSTWLIKVESVGASTFAEVALTTSTEAVVPPTGEWQTYTFPLADLQAAGLDLSAIDIVMVFPAWGTGEGAVFQIDNLEITSPLVASPSLNIFTDEANASWAAWDCCGGSTPVVVQDEDADHGASIEFTVVGDTVLGFNARPDFTDSPEQFDASALMADGVVQFDLKVMTPTADAATPWLMKIESDNAATFAEVNLTTSVEGAAPSSEWQTYTFPVADLVQAGLDASAIDVLLIFPAWGSGNGAVYRVDNVRIYDPTASGGAFNGHVLFKDGALDAWALWDCCGGSTPKVVADDLDHGAVARFEVGEAPTVLGYNSRADFASEPSQIDASSLLTDGVLQFEMKVVNAPNNADAAWLMKIESADAATFAELNLNASVEGADPAVGVWQTYTFNLSDLSTAGLDVSAIDVVMVFPAWGTGEGAVYLLDNVMIYDPNSLPIRKGITIFENGQTDWAMWDCCGGSIPTVKVDDNVHGTAAEFVVGEAPTVLGFNARAEISSTPTVYDASALLTDGYLRFDMKVVTPPNNADAAWLMKIESSGAATFAELNLNTSVEGADPAVGVWQTYTFNLSDLSTAGLDVSAIDVVMVFPAWGTGEGAVYRIDNMVISAP